jgi:hypothetical protein
VVLIFSTQRETKMSKNFSRKPRWEETICRCKRMGRGCMYWIHLAQDRVKGQAVFNVVVYHRVGFISLIA